MDLLMVGLIGVLFALSFYLIFQGSLWSFVLGSVLITNAANLFLIVQGGNPLGKIPPLLQKGTSAYFDPLPPALILTAIVIGFALSGLVVAIAFQVQAGPKQRHPGDWQPKGKK